MTDTINSLPNDLFDCHCLIQKLQLECNLQSDMIDDFRSTIANIRSAVGHPIQDLIEVVNNCHKAEQELAALIIAVRNEDLEAVNTFLNKHNTNMYVE